jgi:hypothetical protein
MDRIAGVLTAAKAGGFSGGASNAGAATDE